MSAGVDLRTALRFWLLLGCISFGGPAGQIAIMHAELVERRRWVDERDFARALDVCMLLPGPEAMQLATWAGWRLHGLRGGIAAGALFVLPAAVLLALLSWIYMAGHQHPAVGGVVFGLQAAVLGLLAAALERLGRRVLARPAALAIALAALLAVGVAHVAFPWVVLGAATVGWAIGRLRPQWLALAGGGVDDGAPSRPMPSIRRSVGVAVACLAAWLLPLLALSMVLGPDSTLVRLGAFLSRAALVTVGGAYAVLPYVARHAVDTYGWLQPDQMMAGMGLAETTPGPLILVLEYVGFVAGWRHPELGSPLASGLAGAAVAVWATFLPSFLFVLSLAPWVERIGRASGARAALAGVTAAVVGVIAQLALWFGGGLLGSLSPARAAIALVLGGAVYAGVARRRWPVQWLVPACGAIGAFVSAWVA